VREISIGLISRDAAHRFDRREKSMTDNQNDSAFAEAMLRATLAMLVERRMLHPTDIDIIVKAANDRVRHGIDMKVEHVPALVQPVRMRGAA
jgi:hypothetical protein